MATVQTFHGPPPMSAADHRAGEYGVCPPCGHRNSGRDYCGRCEDDAQRGLYAPCAPIIPPAEILAERASLARAWSGGYRRGAYGRAVRLAEHDPEIAYRLAAGVARFCPRP